MTKDIATKKPMDMCNGPLFKNILLYTLPIILTGVLQLLFNAADLVVVGLFCGSVSVGAVGSTGSLVNLFLNLFIGLSTGSGVVVAQSLGAKNETAVHKTVHTAIPVAIISGAVLTVVGLIVCRPMLELMGTPEENIDLAHAYLTIYFCGTVVNLLYNFGAAILRAAGNTRGPLIYLTIAGVLNVVLNVIFVSLFDMNVAGVALATVLSQALSAVLVLRDLMKRTDACKLVWKKLKIYKETLFKIVRIGLPAGIQGSLFSISNVIIQSSINSFGSVALNGSAAAANIEGFIYITMNSFYQAVLNFTGQNIGANRYDRVKKILWICYGSASVVGIVLGCLVALFAEPLLSIYITDSVESISYGMIRLYFISLPYFLCGLMECTTGVLRGMGSSLSPMLISVLGVCGFRLMWIYTVFQIPALHTLECLFVSYPISWLLVFFAELIVYFILMHRHKKKALATT